MKVLLITGSYPPDICGVADYTAALEDCLRKAGVHVSVYSGRRWGVSNAVHIAHQLRASGADILHMQYPARGYGWKLGPQVLGVLQPLVITIHECSQAHILRQLSLYPFTFRAPKIIFTSEYERRYVQQFVPSIEHRSAVIPIGSNVPVASGQIGRLRNVVTYFGLIRPEKGLEHVLEMASYFKTRGNGLSVRIVGTVRPGDEDYHGHLRDKARELPVQWVLGLNGDWLSRALAETEVAYLPFPDGASERRSSLIAMLTNRAAVLTTHGLHTPPDMGEAVQLTNSPIEAGTLAEEMYNNPERRAAKQSSAGEYAVKFAWENIAAQHVAIYQQLIASRPEAIQFR
jgi:glycosyltransferase involved in cell wall biosynthesis